MVFDSTTYKFRFRFRNMEALQTTGTDEEANLDFSECEAEGDVKGTKKRDRKKLFQINTHPATLLAKNNKRDRRLKQIVMHVVAFCKREHDEGQQIPFRFFKKRASLMTGVSLSTIHRIETIDMRLPDLAPSVTVGAATTTTTTTTAASPSSPAKGKGSKSEGNQKKPKKKKKKESSGEAGEVVVHASSHDVVTAAAAATMSAVAVPGPVVQLGDLGSLNNHIHFQALSAAAPALLGTQPLQPHPAFPTAVHVPVTATAAKPAKKRRKKDKGEIVQVLPTAVAAVLQSGSNNNSINNNTSNNTLITTMQPAVLHSVSAAGPGGGSEDVTTISVHNAMSGGQRAAPCTWTAGPIGPFTMGELRPDAIPHAVHVPASATHVQVSAQHVPVGAAIQAVGAQLQPITVGPGTQHAFTGHLDTSGWTAGGMGAFGTLPATATLVGPQVVHAYQGNVTTAAAAAGIHSSHQQQQQHQQQHVFYQFQ